MRRRRAAAAVGLEVDWTDVEQLYERYGLTPAAPAQASRVAVPVYSGDKQVGKATTTQLVSDAEEDDRAGQRRDGVFEAGDSAADGNHDRGDPAEDQCEGDAHCRSSIRPENGDAGLEKHGVRRTSYTKRLVRELELRLSRPLHS